MTAKITYELSAEARSFNWLLDKFATDTSGVIEVIAVSSDGLLMAMSTSQHRSNADRLAAITSGINSLSGGAARWYELGGLNKVIVDMDRGYLLMSAISRGSVLGVIASKGANLGNIAYEMTLFANRAGTVLTPELINELKNALES